MIIVYLKHLITKFNFISYIYMSQKNILKTIIFPIGGYPPIIYNKQNKIKSNEIKNRCFATGPLKNKNININKIMNSNKKPFLIINDDEFKIDEINEL